MKGYLVPLVFVTTLTIGLGYSLYLHYTRESNFWWSKINDVEKLISFRTEQGLFYSYYQEFIQQANILNGFYVLLRNNMTEFPTNINIIKRMNIWQEIYLGSIYRMIKILQIDISPIEFYVNCVLLLQGLSIGSIFLLSCVINSSILTGLLTVAFYALNRHSMSRAAYLLPLRENFALPFWWLHVLTLHWLIRSKKPSLAVQRITRFLFHGSTFLFCLQWQFSQFVILIECGVIFVLDMFEFISRSMARSYYWTALVSFLITCFMQIGNVMLFSSFTVAVLVSSLILGSFKTPGMMHSSFSGRLTWISIQSTGRLLLSFIIRYFMTWILKQDDDAHIFQFLAIKFGIGTSRNFDVNLYKCHTGFGWLQIDTFMESLKMVIYPYFAVYVFLALLLFISAVTVLWHDTDEEVELHPTIHESVVGAEGDFCSGCGHVLSDHPELAYHFGMSTGMCMLAMMVERMQYLFTPYIIMFASMFYGNCSMYNKISKSISCFNKVYIEETMNESEGNKRIKISQRSGLILKIIEWSRQAIVIGLICRVANEAYHSIKLELSDLREFYDPDTVQLMDWIRMYTYPNDSFAGSMQLMAAVKLIGERPIVNHPHYEDAGLRSKTQKLYQMYARREPEYVAHILKYYHVSHIILEDSICLAKSSGCQLKDLMDLANGHITEQRYYSDYDLHYVTTPRFCDAIRFMGQDINSSFRKYFLERFVNPTFRVYRVL